MTSRTQKDDDVDVKKLFPKFLAFPGIRGGILYFDPDEGHIYRYFVSKDRPDESPWTCCSNQIISYFESLNSSRQHKCTAILPCDQHNHAVPSRSSVEFHTFYWACQLHLVHCPYEITPDNAMIQHVASTWPLKHFTDYDDWLVPRLKIFFNSVKGSSKMENFKNNLGNEQLTNFIIFLKSNQPYWSPLPRGEHQNNSQAPPYRTDSKKDRKELEPPTGLNVDFVTAKTAKLSWAPLHSSFSYRVRYWPKGQPALAIECPSPNNSCSLEQLSPETTYSVSAMAVSEDGLYNSASKEIIELTTISENLRFAEMLKNSSTKIEGNGGMQLYSVPLDNCSCCSMPEMEHFVFGTPDATQQNRKILLIGAGGSGKSKLVDAMINYIFNVQWEDNFRFQLTKKRPSKTNRISVYEIHHTKGFRIPYPLTIINTPGFSGDLKADEEVAKMIGKCLGGPDGAQQLEMIGFVVPSLNCQLDMQIHIFNSLQSIFGKSVIEEKVKFLITSADRGVPPILDFIVNARLPCLIDLTGQPIYYKFNDSCFFYSSQQSIGGRLICTVDKFNHFLWNMGMESFLKLFNAL